VLHLYRLLLLLYPRAHRQEFAEEMLTVFRQIHRDFAPLGLGPKIRFCLRETAGLLAGAFGEHMKARNRALGGVMRTFRFPRWTVALLVLALLVVLAGIDVIARQSLSFGANISPRWAFLELLQVAAVVMSVLGLIGFVLRAALGRSLIRRLPAVRTWPAPKGEIR
jgi:hypothetical protein